MNAQEYRLYLNRGNKLRENQELDLAIREYQKALNVNPDSAEVLVKIADIYYDRGNLTAAIATWHQAIKSQPNVAEAYKRLGDIWFEQRKLNLSMRAYYKVLELNPDWGEVHTKLAEIYEHQGNLEGAIESYKKVITIQPDIPDPYWKLAKIFARQEKIAEAKTCQQQALEIQRNIKMRHSLCQIAAQQQPIRIIVGSGAVEQADWIATDIDPLNLLKPETWGKYFSNLSIDAILAENVWEKLTKEEGMIAANNCYQYLKEGGYLRVAVPDGFNPSKTYIEWVKPGGKGKGARNHKMLYNYRELKEVFEKVGFEVTLLEFFDERGNFHERPWNDYDGKINRSKRFDERNQDGQLNYTSIILDAKKIKPIPKAVPPQKATLNLNYLETSGWVKSMKVRKPVNFESQPIPWYNYPAIEFIENKIDRDFVIFEYGSGHSTLWWQRKVERVISVETDPQWFEYIKSQVGRNVRVSLIQDYSSYANEILKYEDNFFDVIIIDGRNRNRCAENCSSKLKENGMIIFDNTDREKYNAGIEFLRSQNFKRIDFYGMTPCYHYKTCTSIFFKRDELLAKGVLPSQKKSCLGLSLGQGESIQI